MVLEKTLESPLDCKKIKPVNPQGNQSWLFLGRTDAEGETPIVWPPHAKKQLIGKDPDAGKDWRQEEEGATWHYQLDGHESEQDSVVSDGQGSLVCCSPWGCQESDTTERLNWTDYIKNKIIFYIKNWRFLLFKQRPEGSEEMLSLITLRIFSLSWE